MLFKLSRPILECEGCGLVYAEPRGESARHDEYTECYYRDGIYADYLADRPMIHRNAARNLSELEGLTRGRTLLDVGCAAGFFLEAARARGWTVSGLEVSEYASSYARRELGLAVDTGSIVRPPDGLSRFDVVTLWDVIEHLDRPDRALANIRGLLLPNGVLALSTGDHGSLLRRATGRRWRLFGDPTHNFFFDERTLTRLLAQEGYEIVRVTRRGKWVSLAMIVHQSGLPLWSGLRAWVRAISPNLALYVNLWDVMTVFSRPVLRRQSGTSSRP